MLSKETSEVESAKIFVFKFAKTFDPDEANENEKIKNFPEKDYIHDFIEVWLRERFLAISKSRQMLGTWICIALYCWDTYRHMGRFTIFKSVDKAHSGLGTKLALLWRAKFIHDNLPSCIRPRIVPKKRDNILEYPDTNGHIQAMSMEADASVSFTASGCFDDELSAQQYGEAGFTVIQPLLGVHGRYTAVATPRGENFWYRLVEDKIDGD